MKAGASHAARVATYDTLRRPLFSHLVGENSRPLGLGEMCVLILFRAVCPITLRRMGAVPEFEEEEAQRGISDLERPGPWRLSSLLFWPRVPRL